MCDIVKNTLRTDICLINSGSFRSDMVHAAGDFTLGDLIKMFPFSSAPVCVSVTGEVLLKALENSVAHYPLSEGRFCQVCPDCMCVSVVVVPFVTYGDGALLSLSLSLSPAGGRRFV